MVPLKPHPLPGPTGARKALTPLERGRIMDAQMVRPSREAAMRTRTFPWRVSAGVVIAAVATATSWAQAQQPNPSSEVDERGPLERRAVPITTQNPIPKRTAILAALYPLDVPDHTVRGTVTLSVTLDASGHVAEARQAYRPDPSMIPRSDGSVESGRPLPAPFVKAALDAVRTWQYEMPVQAPISFYVRLQFTPDQPTSIIWHDARPPLSVTLVSGGVNGLVTGATQSDLNRPASVDGTTRPPAAAPVRVGGQIQAPRKIKDVSPVYPPEAQQARIEGIVILEATIGVDGHVSNARILRSLDSRLDQAAVDAVRQWEFTPTLIEGQPAPILMSVTVRFTLAAPPAPR
jgi:TonB family protein